MQSQLHIPELKLKQDCPTRWNSMYDMLQRMDAVVSTLAIIKPSINKINADDCVVIKYALNILKNVDEITKEVKC